MISTSARVASRPGTSPARALGFRDRPLGAKLATFPLAIPQPDEEQTMHFQVRTDNHIENSEALTSRIRDEVEGALTPRYTDRIRRVEVYLQDVNGHKGGLDTRCSIEISLAGHQPVAAAELAAGLDEAVAGAVDKVLRVLDHTIGKMEDRGGKVSMSGEGT
jgi:hypothetical protein